MASGIEFKGEVLNQKGTPLLVSDTLANRPAAGVPYRKFFQTDSPFAIYQDNGTSWDQMFPGASGITGSGTIGFIPVFTASGVIGNSVLSQVSSNFKLAQNSVDVLTSENTGAIVNTLYLKTGFVGIYNSAPLNKLHITATLATTSELLLRLSGGATGFSGTNDAGTKYSLVFDACAFDNSTGVVQRDGAKISFEKENTWNSTPIRGALAFFTSAGSAPSPTLLEGMRLNSRGELQIGSSAATAGQEKLQVTGTASISSSLLVGSIIGSGTPLVLNSTGSTEKKITFQDAAATVGAIGMSAAVGFKFYGSTSGAVLLGQLDTNGIFQSNKGEFSVHVQAPVLKYTGGTDGCIWYSFQSGGSNQVTNLNTFKFFVDSGVNKLQLGGILNPNSDYAGYVGGTSTGSLPSTKFFIGARSTVPLVFTFGDSDTETARVFGATGNWAFGGTTDNGYKMEITGALNVSQYVRTKGIKAAMNSQSLSPTETIFTDLISTLSGNIVVNLPANGAAPYQIYVFKKTTSDANTVSITPNGAELIDGVNAPYVLTLQNEAVMLHGGSGAGDWYVIGKYL